MEENSIKRGERKEKTEKYIEKREIICSFHGSQKDLWWGNIRALQEVLKIYVVGGKLLAIEKTFYENSKAKVWVNGEDSEGFRNKGVVRKI